MIRTENLVNTVGREIFEGMEKKIKNNPSSFRIFAEEKASDLLMESTGKIVDTLYQHGILNEGEHHAKFINLFKSNLAGQVYGVRSGKGDIIRTDTAAERAQSVCEVIINKYPKTMTSLSEKGINIYKLYYAVRDMFLKENLQVDYISGQDLKPETESVAGIAVNRRMCRTDGVYHKAVLAIGANPNDDREMKDFVRQSKFRDIIRRTYKDEDYFARRDTIIQSKESKAFAQYDITDSERDIIPLFKNVDNSPNSNKVILDVLTQVAVNLGVGADEIVSRMKKID